MRTSGKGVSNSGDARPTTVRSQATAETPAKQMPLKMKMPAKAGALEKERKPASADLSVPRNPF